MKFKLLLLIYAFAALTVLSQSPGKLLKQAEQAMGGTKSLRTVTSWHRRGTIKRVEDGATGNVVMQTSLPSFYNISIELDGFEIEYGYNGKSAWTRDSRQGLRTLTGPVNVDFQAEAAFRNSLWLNAKKEKAKIVASGNSEVAGKRANILIMNTGKGPAIKLYFDAASNVLLREEFPAGGGVRAFEYSDHRVVKGIKQPYRVRMETEGAVYEIAFDEVTANAKIAKAEFDFPDLSTEPLPDIPSLLRELQANEDKVENILDTYSFIQRYIRRAPGKDGVLRETGSETFQLSFYKGNRISRLIEKNGKALSADDQADEDKKAARSAEEIEKRIAKKAAGDNSSEERPRISIAEMLRASTLTNPRRERFRGRDVIVFDFEPNPTFDYKNSKSMLKFFGKTAGAMWIDEKDKQVARIEAFLFDNYKVGGGLVAKLKKGASFTLEQERVNDEIWLPSTADINLSVRLFLVKGIDLNQIIRSYDYRKFSTEVKDAKVDPIKQ